MKKIFKVGAKKISIKVRQTKSNAASIRNAASRRIAALRRNKMVIVPVLGRKNYGLSSETVDLLKRTMKYSIKLGMKMPTIKNIGLFKDNPITHFNIASTGKFPKLINLPVLYEFAEKMPARSSKMVRMIGNMEDELLRGLTKMGYPEFTLQNLFDRGYFEKRKSGWASVSEEAMLKQSLIDLEKKYGKKEVVKLKKRLGIGKIFEEILRSH
ncbi:MAG: hypothetical protein NTZ73_03080 [Candidatus Diapherotrites archaeon]|nr:hypothetical protein [Candidatus Diapherotrites archaeon]